MRNSGLKQIDSEKVRLRLCNFGTVRPRLFRPVLSIASRAHRIICCDWFQGCMYVMNSCMVQLGDVQAGLRFKELIMDALNRFNLSKQTAVTSVYCMFIDGGVVAFASNCDLKQRQNFHLSAKTLKQLFFPLI
jgi:hypothetical protein